MIAYLPVGPVVARASVPCTRIVTPGSGFPAVDVTVPVTAIDWLSALEAWDATGKPPATILGTHPPAPAGTPQSSAKPFTRPVCPYPQLPKYKGAGDEADAANWRCAAE